MPVSRPTYVTREEVARELDYHETPMSNARVDRAISTASRTVEGRLHRVFYPQQDTRSFNWPNRQRARPWRLWLDDNELISITTLSSGGETIAAGDYFLEPNTSGPPFNLVEIDLASSAAFGGGDTHQQSITITGLFGYHDEETALGVTGEALDAAETAVDVDAETSAEVGVGSILRVEEERLLVTGRAQLDTGQTLANGAGLDDVASDVSVSVQDGGAFAVDEVLLLDSERLLITDIAANTLTVKRGWDGTVLTTHTQGAGIFAQRTLTVQRGALGTTAAAHALGAQVWRWDPPAPVKELALAEALNHLLQGGSGYARTVGSGDNERESSGRGLGDLRKTVKISHGRKARHRGV
ncbi:hypothetical protein RM572_00375 [Streptomyces sp. DSM 42041]|uniref:Uncharacterized protein n=1 Tax=Streptomyces hazeniae TaxID=3075538 RepID=A0ABU2NJQ7_9ACTN|nr:hypothetical protein [Streptomyces sp. DSM 42041]MDT0377231.1 hypothetical protein [Streptomyces sp. DSM 42041]